MWYLPGDFALFVSVRDAVGDLTFDAFLESDGEPLLELGRRFFLDDLGETGLLGGDGLRSFFDIFFEALGDTKYNSKILFSFRNMLA